jgi:hypothetical protein
MVASNGGTSACANSGGRPPSCDPHASTVQFSSPPAAPPPHQHQQPLWDSFVVVGLPRSNSSALATVHGEPGFLGSASRYKPVFIDSLPHSSFDEHCRLPPQLPIVSLPEGVAIVLAQDVGRADLTPRTYACVLTGEGVSAVLARAPRMRPAQPRPA